MDTVDKRTAWWMKLIPFFTLIFLLFIASFVLVLFLSPGDLTTFIVFPGIVTLIGTFLIMKEINHKHLMILNFIGMIIVAHFGLTELARYFVKYIARHITDSVVQWERFNHIHRALDKINWDTALKETVYTLYGAIFIIVTIFVLYLLKKNNGSKIKNRIISSLFILSFPTITSWQIESTCHQHLCFYDYQPLDVVTPLIMSINPLYMLFSLTCALLILKAYSKLAKIDIF